jgi:hypothetical protein
MEDLVVVNKDKAKKLIKSVGSDIYSEFIRLSNNDNLILTQENYNFLKNKIVSIEGIDPEKIKTKKTLICLQMYYEDLFKEVNNFIIPLIKDYNCDVIITTIIDSSYSCQKQWIYNHFTDLGCKFYVVDNKGLDIGPFLLSLKKSRETETKYDYIIKVHTKKSIYTSKIGNEWRDNLTYPIIGNTKLYEYNVHTLMSNEDIGMLGSKEFKMNDNLNINMLRRIVKALFPQYKDRLEEPFSFIGGTIFMAKMEIFDDFTDAIIDDLYSNLEPGYFTDYAYNTTTHAVERLFGAMVNFKNKIIQAV